MSKNITVQQFMTRLPIELAPSSLLTEAQEIMRDQGIRHIPIVEGTKIYGILSDRDVKFALALNIDHDQLTVAEMMSTEIFFAHPTDPLGKVSHEMAVKKIGSALVKDGDVLVGLFTTTDALEALAYIQGYAPSEEKY